MSLRILISTVLAAGLSAASAFPVHAEEASAYPKAAAVCTPVGVANFNARIHVRCSVAVSGISYFVVPTSNANRAARVLTLFTVALASGRDLRITYDPTDLSGVPIGCQSNDCRLADIVELL
jgi:hypothetical protein